MGISTLEKQRTKDALLCDRVHLQQKAVRAHKYLVNIRLLLFARKGEERLWQGLVVVARY